MRYDLLRLWLRCAPISAPGLYLPCDRIYHAAVRLPSPWSHTLLPPDVCLSDLEDAISLPLILLANLEQKFKPKISFTPSAAFFRLLPKVSFLENSRPNGNCPTFSNRSHNGKALSGPWLRTNWMTANPPMAQSNEATGFRRWFGPGSLASRLVAHPNVILVPPLIRPLAASPEARLSTPTTAR